MRTVVGLDLSCTCTGHAVWRGGALTTGRFTPRKGLVGKERRRWIAEQVAGLADTVDVDPLLVIEAVSGSEPDWRPERG